ncbi:MAG: cytochrome c biogenesis protein ResB, partial [Culturomica sp.]|nr:cytochrome c biogenesis protein ResB [Culturomica sp.]
MRQRGEGSFREYGKHLVLCAGLFGAGVLLQPVAGKTGWPVLAFPVNALAGGGYLLLLSALFFGGSRKPFFRWATGFPASVSAIVSLVFPAIVVGSTRRHVYEIFSCSFALLTGWFLTVLWLVILKRLNHFTRRDIPFLFHHLGLFLAVTGAALGSADRQQLEMILATGRSEWRGTDEKGGVTELPFTVQLDCFIMEEDPAKPERYASQVTLYTRSGRRVEALVEVNKPFR